ncbi:MAG: type II/IV secretion system protein [Verrucomicrobia bacterium]|jgi:type IV pilus assembly protein PilB|nr:type II/IV secretion system protein [Verrucomicrobiota bacterium]NBS84292.1 type II/IV secretion system protein [Verrucomicrobiota bacterium]
MDPRFLLPFLEEQNILSSEQSREISEELSRTGKPIETVLTNFGIIQMPQILEKISDSLGLPLILDLSNLELSPELLARIPPHTARNVGAIPLAADETTLTVALADPLATQALEDLRFATGAEISQVVAPPDKILPLIEKYYGAAETNIDDILTELENAPETALASEGVDLSEAGSAPIIKYVNTIIARAIQAKASDIHFEPFEKEFKIRYRVDGALYEMAPPPRRLAIPVTSRIKVMANLNIAERRIPQDGRIQTLLAGRQVDLRVSTLPTQYGESIVLRVLDRSVVNLDLEKLGIPKHIYDYVCDTLEKPNGIFIVTGPTGSGKTTTLYSCLGRINTIDTKILTVEDPVEYELEGIIQVPANEGIGLTFARALRAFLRQDPDKILVGETRDLETAQIAIQASLTGHLVMTSLHTNDAAGAVTRLLDMGVEPFLIAASMEGVLAQRLLRRVCKDCRTPFQPKEEVLTQIGLTASDVGDRPFYFGKGCESCNGTGYRGRVGIYELLDIREPIRQLINERAPSVVIRQKGIELGMTTLRQDGIRNILEGHTTLEEVLKYT